MIGVQYGKLEATLFKIQVILSFRNFRQQLFILCRPGKNYMVSKSSHSILYHAGIGSTRWSFLKFFQWEENHGFSYLPIHNFWLMHLPPLLCCYWKTWNPIISTTNRSCGSTFSQGWIILISEWLHFQPPIRVHCVLKRGSRIYLRSSFGVNLSPDGPNSTICVFDAVFTISFVVVITLFWWILFLVVADDISIGFLLIVNLFYYGTDGFISCSFWTVISDVGSKNSIFISAYVIVNGALPPPPTHTHTHPHK